MSRGRYISCIIALPFLMAFMQSPQDMAGKYYADLTFRPKTRLRVRFELKKDSTVTIRVPYDDLPINGKWKCINDTLVLYQVIAPEDIPKDRIDSIFFDLRRFNTWEYYVVNADTLREIYQKDRLGQRYLRVIKTIDTLKVSY